jgi:hypothetical protein
MKTGDKVRFLNAVGGGTVKRFQGKNMVWVEEEDGFETPVLIKECVVVGGELPAGEAERRLLESDFPGDKAPLPPLIPEPLPPPAGKEKRQPWIEVDLHINQLLESTAGLTNTDMLNVQLDTFRKTLEKYKNKKGQKIVFIHGKGEGVLKNALLDELKSKYKRFSFHDASFREYGFGATMVIIPTN